MTGSGEIRVRLNAAPTNHVRDVEEAAPGLNAQDYRGEKKPIARLERCGGTTA